MNRKPTVKGSQEHAMASYPIEVSDDQSRLLNEYGRMVYDVNRQFNLISRGDINEVYSHHIAHCLVLADRKVPSGTRVVDWGTGGGLPAIPLAIMWPHIAIVGVDSNEKKTRAVDLFCRRLGIRNCTSWHGRAEEMEGQFQVSVSRATAPLRDLWSWHERIYSPIAEQNAQENRATDMGSGKKEASGAWGDGLVCLKGGDLAAEIGDLHAAFPDLAVNKMPLALLKNDPFFDTKCIITVQKR